MKRLLLAIVTVAVVSLLATRSPAQIGPNPPENHYLVYLFEYTAAVDLPGLTLRDQWGTWYPGDVYYQDKWANPLFLKNGEDVTWDPLLHHAWYKLEEPLANARSVIVEHQWGAYDLVIRNAKHLIVPADKHNQIPGIPIGNHYLCYEAIGTPLQFPVDLSDQWGQHRQVAWEPVCFCNPVEKILPGGESYPPVDPRIHLTCYRLDPLATTRPVDWEDQFGLWVNDSSKVECLICLPSIKTDIVPTEESTWGRIKEIYKTEE